MFAVCIGKSEPFPLKTALALPSPAAPGQAAPRPTAPRHYLHWRAVARSPLKTALAQPRPAAPCPATPSRALPRHAETHKTKLTAPSATFHETGARQAHQIQLSTRP